MKSLRKQLIGNLMLAMLIGSTAIACLLYLKAHAEIDELYNAHLRQLATTLAYGIKNFDGSEMVANAASSENSDIHSWEEENFLIQIWSTQGKLIDSSRPDIGFPLQPKEGFHKSRFNGDSWRSHRKDEGIYIVQVSQPELARRGVTTETSMELLLPLLLQVPVFFVLVLLAVKQGLKPLILLSGTIRARQPQQLEKIPSADLPVELQPLVSALNDLLQRLQQLIARQGAFIADAAHELRTPLSALQLQVDTLKRTQSQSERDNAISKLSDGVTRAAHLARQLLTIARAEDAEKNSNAICSLDKIATNTTTLLIDSAHKKNIDFGFIRIEAVNIKADADEVAIIVANIIDNAIRYTPENGMIDISIFSDRGYSIIEVSDTGPGIAPEIRERIFDRFFRAADNTSDGAGLGLAIVKRLCDGQNARIEVVDDQHSGACFRVRWPSI